MHSVLTISFSLVLVGLTYGLSFLPSDKLNPGNPDDTVVLTDADTADGDNDTSIKEEATG